MIAILVLAENLQAEEEGEEDLGGPYTITFNANGGAVTHETGTTGKGGTLASLPTPTRIGYAFDDWHTAATGGTKVTENTVYSMDTTIYARWALIDYEITYELNSGTVSSANPIIYTIETQNFTLINPVRTGYAFKGWTGANGTAPQTTVTIPLGSTGDKSYTANWTLTYTITFDANGGTVTHATGTTGKDQTLDFLPEPTRIGYEFKGWFTSAIDGTKVTENKEYSTNTTIYAQWAPTDYTITYNLGGGTVSSNNPIIYTIETPDFTLVNPKKEGYTFAGWTGANGTAPQTTVTIPLGSTGDKIYTANWTLITYTITFNANGGTVTPATGTTGEGGTLASLPTPTRIGYAFDGWYTAATGGTKVTENTVYSADTTIYARWRCSYLDANGEAQYVSDFTEMNNSTSTLSGWYLVRGNLTSSTLTVSSTANIILADNSSLTAAGIRVSGSSSLTIYVQSTGNNMGSLTATGSNGGAGIGGGSGNSGGTVTINGGTITATGSNGGAGIGSGNNGYSAGTFAMNGNAIVFANSVDDASARTKGILFVGNDGTLYGTSVTLNSAIIPANYTLSIPTGSTLTVPIGTTLTNNGAIIPADGSTITVHGTLSGKINGANTAFPTVIMRTATSVMLGDSTKLLAITGQGIEYAISENSAAPASGWQTRTVFTGLKPETAYYVFARSKENDNFKAGAASAALPVSTMSAITVIATPHHCISAACASAASYYTLYGVSLGTQKPTAPGVYMEKRGGVSRKIVVHSGYKNNFNSEDF